MTDHKIFRGSILVMLVLFIVAAPAGAQVSRSGMGVFYGLSRITDVPFTTNTGSLVEYSGEVLSMPHSLYGFSYESRQLFKYGLYTNYRIILASHHIGLEDYTGTDYSFESLSYFNASFAPEIGFDLLKNMGYKKLSGKRRLMPFIDNALNVFGGVELCSPAFSIRANRSVADAGKQAARTELADLLYTRKFHFNVYAGAGLRVKRVEVALQYYFYSSKLFGITISDPLLYRPMVTFILKYSI